MRLRIECEERKAARVAREFHLSGAASASAGVDQGTVARATAGETHCVRPSLRLPTLLQTSVISTRQNTPVNFHTSQDRHTAWF